MLEPAVEIGFVEKIKYVPAQLLPPHMLPGLDYPHKI
jgi:hypothetical protein